MRLARDDFYDPPSGLPADGLLRQALVTCDELLRPAFEEADAAALDHQARHHLVVGFATVFGTVAVLAALALETIGRPHVATLDVFRYSGGAIALAAIALGLFAQLQQRWYLRRHVAERLCLLKYQALLRLGLDVDEGRPESLVAWQQTVRGDVREICGLHENDMRGWASNIVTPVHVPAFVGTAASERFIRSFKEYYCRPGGRLIVQETYFKERSRRYDATDTRLRSVVPLLFLSGVALSFLYAEYPLFEKVIAAGSGDLVGRALSAAAAGCIALAAMVRTFRTSDEYARNTMRFSAVYRALEALGRRLSASAEPRSIIQGIGDIEAVLEDEHREWLRLMLEADWH